MGDHDTMLAQPGAHAGDRMIETARKLLRLIDKRDRWKIGVLLALMIFNALMQMIGVAAVFPFLAVLGNPDMVHSNQWLNYAYESLGFEETRSFLFALGIASFVVFLLSSASSALTNWITTRFSHMRQYGLSQQLMADYLRRPYSFFLNRNASDLAKTVLEETRHAVHGALMPALRLVSTFVNIAALVVLLLLIEPALTLGIAIGLGGLYGTIYLTVRKWLRRIGEERVEANRLRFMAVNEAFAGAKEIRLLAREPIYLERYRKPARQFSRHQANAAIVQALPSYFVEALVFGGVLAALLYLMGTEAGLGAALPIIGVFALASKKLIPGFQKLFETFSTLRFTVPAVENLLNDLGARDSDFAFSAKTSDNTALAPERVIRVDNVTYRYPGSEYPALDSVSLEIPAQTTVGLVGSSGAGKSTLVDVLLGLLEPEAGKIRIDDRTLDRTNVRQWQSAIGYVPQHIFLADDTIAANIALGVPARDIDHAAVQRAARLANLHDFVTAELPLGYETEIGDRGVRLSGGQRQRIGIARALYNDPPVLVFDEATSALDNATERAVMDAVHNLSGHKTIILIAHRLSTVKPCDTIFVLRKGKALEQGTWEELARPGSEFTRLAANASS